MNFTHPHSEGVFIRHSALRINAARIILLLVGLSLSVVLVGCHSPMERAEEEQLRDQLIASNKAYLKAVADGPIVEMTRTQSEVDKDAGMTDERRKDLETRAGPTAYEGVQPDLGPDLLNKIDATGVQMSLQRAVQLAVEHNLEVRQARLVPGISDAQLLAAEAAFDPVFFANFDWQHLDTPRPSTGAGVSSAFGANKSETTKLETGIRKPLPHGGEIRAQTEFNRNFADPSFYAPPGDSDFRYYDANVLVGINQPLLRNFGSDVTRSNISLARNARGQSVADLRKTLLQTVADTEDAYWALVRARKTLMIQSRLYAAAGPDIETLERRREFDVNRISLAQARSSVEERRSNVLRARQAVRQASDALKRLINSPDLPLAGETMIVPTDNPTDTGIRYSLLDAVTVGLQKRPELQRAILEIDDASIRVQLADNARLPILNLSGAIRYNGVGGSVHGAYDNVTEGDFIDYLLGAQFEMPLGNRAAEAGYSQRKIERQAITLNYQRAAQDVLLDIKNALRQLNTSYEVIGAARASRLAATDNLVAIDDQQRIGINLTPEFIDLKLRTQERVAQAELNELESIINYNIAIARFYQAMGTLLERNNINFEDPYPGPEKETSGWKRLVR